MLVQHYRHRLPADYPMERIRERVAERAPLWAETRGLGFKVFALRERGRNGASENAYASFYLWRETDGAAAFLTGGRFGSVVETFGRPGIDTWLALDVRVGLRAGARTLGRSIVDLDPGRDLGALSADEAERNRGLVARGEALAAISALDLSAWRLVRLTLSSERPSETGDGTAHEILHLAAPGWAQLPASDRI
ncbi:DUF4865 family protein [Methylobacterium nigriterrae]|uniref:DUF4865 family protein n=1 Tax=Methylobacterium nigriterrae TaxID=3127512 RepID=UPI00301331C8